MPSQPTHSLHVAYTLANVWAMRPPLKTAPSPARLAPALPHHDVRVVAALPQLGGVLDVRHHQRRLQGRRGSA